MNLDTFFEKFELFADAPNAVAKMRELILDLATSGRLSEHIDGTWEERSLGDVIELISGQHLLADEHNTQGRGIPYLTGPADFGPAHPVPTRWTETPKVVAEPGDILITVKGAGIGKTNVLIGQKTAISRQLMAIRVRGADPEFIHLTIRRAAEVFQESKTGIAIPGIGRKDVLGLKIKIPPLAEQKRIVAKVDELMALCDRLEAQQQQREIRHTALAQASLTRFADAPTPANLEFLFHKSYAIDPGELRKTILTLAVQGKIVSQDANDEAVENMLLRILDEQRFLKRTIASNIRILAADGRLEYETPESWKWVTLEDISIFGPTNGISPKSVEYETPVRSLTLSATTSGRFKAEHCKYIPMELSTDSDLWLKDGDVLVQRGNTMDYVGVAAVYHGAPHQFVYPDLMMKIRVSSEVDVDFIHLAMSSEPSRSFLRARASGTSGSMPKINQATLKSLPLPIPPLAEQKRIVAKVEQLMGLVDRLEAQLAESRAKATALLDAVVAELSAVA